MRSRLVTMLVAAAMMLGTTSALGDEAALIKELQTGSDYRVRVTAALGLGKLKSASARAALEKALSDSNAAVRASAAAALASMGDAAAAGALKSAIAREKDASIKAQMETALQKIQKPKIQAKYLVKLGKVENKSSVSQDSLTKLLKTHSEKQMGAVAGVEVVTEGDLAATAKSRNLPAFLLDGALKELAEDKSKDGVGVSAKVEYVIRKIPDQALKGSMTGSAKAIGDPAQIKRVTGAMAQLQNDAIEGAVESACKGLGTALDAASKR